MQEPIFREEQYFNQWWLWLFIAIAVLSVWFIAWMQLLVGKPLGDKPMSDFGVILLWIGMGLLFPLLFSTMHLVTEVRADGLYVRFVPFHFKRLRFDWEDIVEAKAVTYSPLKEFGGWGIRYGRAGKAYNVSGNRGVWLRFRNGSRLLIGSQRAEELEQAILRTKGRAGR